MTSSSPAWRPSSGTARGELFLLALDRLLADDPSPAFLTQRTQLPVARFIALLPELGGLS